MKAVLLMLLATTALAPAQIVIVNGKQVDLTPVSAWLKNQQGERPLKHWKAIHIHEIKGEIGGWKKCAVLGEAGDREILLANMPVAAQEFHNSIKAQGDAIDNELAAIEQEDLRIRRARANPPIDATTDGSGYVKIQAYFRQLDIDQERLTERKDAVAKARKDFVALLDQAGDRTFALAMFTEVWDCGRR
jgi:hypothetical protein